MNIDQILINYFYEYGDTLEGLLFVNDNLGEKITRIELVLYKNIIDFYQGDKLIKSIKDDETTNIYIGTNYIDKNIPYSNKVIFELKGYDDVRLFIDLKFDSIIHN